MAWEMLPVNHTDVAWSGLKKYEMITNEDGTVSFRDVTVYSGLENSLFGAREANRMNEALNTIMSMIENGTDLYEAFQIYFETQKRLFQEAANRTEPGYVCPTLTIKADEARDFEAVTLKTGALESPAQPANLALSASNLRRVQISGVEVPSDAYQASNKKYVDDMRADIDRLFSAYIDDIAALVGGDA